MVQIEAFRGFRYDTKKVAIKDVVSPPYDVINQKQRRGYIRNSPYNIVKIILPQKEDGSRDYKLAKEALISWIDKGILKEDISPAIYIYQQQWKAGKGLLSRMGFLSLLKLEGTDKNVLPHEKIFSKPFMDRVRLMKEARAHLSPVFIIYKDSEAKAQALLIKAVKDKAPDADIIFEGVRHKFWHISEKGFIDNLTKILGSAKTFIADGHHRFAASVAVKDYFDKRKISSNGHNYTLAYFVSSMDKGLRILPTHRGVKVLPKGLDMKSVKEKLSGCFAVRQIGYGQISSVLQKAAKRKECGFVIFYKNRYLFLIFKDKSIIKKIGPKENSYAWKRLDVSILHNLVFSKLLNIREKIGSQNNVYYYKDKDELIGKVKSGEYAIAFMLNAPSVDDVEEIASFGEKMPHKSTYFFPKPLTGLLLHKF